MGSSCSTCMQYCNKSQEIVSTSPLPLMNKDLKDSSMQEMNLQPESQQKFRSRRMNKSSRLKGDHDSVDIDIVQELSDSVSINKAKSKNDLSIIEQALGRHNIFNELDKEMIKSIIDSMMMIRVQAGQFVFQQGQLGKYFYVIKSGQVEVLVNNAQKNVLNSGSSFGEIALLHNTKRTAGIRCITDTILWALNRQTFRDILKSLNRQKYESNLEFLQSIPVFSCLSSRQMINLVETLVTHKYQPEENIVIEGDPGDLCFIIVKGSVRCIKGGVLIRTMKQGDFFGEQALLYNCNRTATITAIDKVKCLSINRDELNAILGSQLQSIIYKNVIVMAIEQDQALNILTQEAVEQLLSRIQVRRYTKNQVIAQHSCKIGDNLYIVVKGEIKLKGKRQRYPTLSCIGAQQLMNSGNESFRKSLIASKETDVAFISKQDFFFAVGNLIKGIDQDNMYRDQIKALSQVYLLKRLSKKKLRLLSQKLTLTQFRQGEVIIEQNSVGNTFYIINAGSVKIYRNGAIVRSISKYGYFGERALIENEPRSATVVAHEDTLLWVLQKEDFQQCIGSSIRKTLIRRIELHDNGVQFDHLCPMQQLGNGMFGTVFLTVHREKNMLYALKSVNRLKIASMDIFENLVLERDVMLLLDHPFVVKLVKTFKDPERVYFLMEFVRGMDLFDALREIGLVTGPNAKFYTASLILVLDHLHSHGIIYRDLKPENVMVDKDGYIKLIDFGTARIVKDRTFTIVGTPHYMAPEVIKGKGYFIEADYWSLGIMLYEFMCGEVPFGDDVDDPLKIYDRIIEYNLKFPPFFKGNEEAKDMIGRLLNPNPALRLQGNVTHLQKHQWFNGFSWGKLIQKKLPAPFVPKMSKLNQEIREARQRETGIFEVLQQADNAEKLSRLRNQLGRIREPTNWDKDF